MSLYSYKVKTKKGELVEDVIQSTSRKEAAQALKSDGFQILTIRRVDSNLSSLIGGKISVSEKAAFCRFVATMLRAGLTLPEAIDIIKEETKNNHFKKIIYDMSFQVRKGNSLSSVMSKYKSDFDPVFLTMIKAGEESGTMDKSFDYLATQLMASYELTQKVKGAMMYPMVIVVAMFGNFIVMLVFVLPKLSQVFTQLHLKLPTATRIIMDIGNFVGSNTILVIGSLVLLIGLGALVMIIGKTREFISNLFLKFPPVKKIASQLDVARFSRTLATLLRSGVPIMVALDVSADMVRLPNIKKKSKSFSKAVATGLSLSDVISEGKGVFPPIVVQTIKAGEKTGSLEIVLDEMATFYEKEVDFTLKRFTALLEPVLMLVIGIAVGAMVIIMIVPIYNLVGGLEGSF